MVERISIELTNRCAKACWFCYNGSHRGGDTLWITDEVVSFVRDCAAHGTRAVSFGGGEPLEYAGVYDVLARLDGVLFRSVTTNGLLLDRGALTLLVQARPDKVHVSLHFPDRVVEVRRVIRHVNLLADHGIAAGVNLLVTRSGYESAARAADALRAAGVDNDRIIYLPMRGGDAPTAEQIAAVSGDGAFQSPTCLLACSRSPRFCSIRWDKTVAWCSYTQSRRSLATLDYAGLVGALQGLGLEYCGEKLVQIGVGLSTSQREPAGEPEPEDYAPPIPADFPAAHSMDTEWFATDAEGRVAMFDSEAPGAVPNIFLNEVRTQYSFLDMLDLLLDESSPSAVRFFADDIIAEGPGQVFSGKDRSEPWHKPLSLRRVPSRALRGAGRTGLTGWILDKIPLAESDYTDAVCWLSNSAAIRTIKAWEIRRLPVSDHAFVWVDGCPSRILYRMFKEGSILSLLLSSGFDNDVVPERFGLYRYGDPSYICGPYSRLGIPSRPIRLDQLPPAAQAVCRHVCFDHLRFDCTLRIQPAELMPCTSEYPEWQDLEGNMHRFPEKSR